MKYCLYWSIKHGLIGNLLFKYFGYVFPLSKEEILWKYPNLENRYIEELKKKFGENILIFFEYSKSKYKHEVDVYYIKNDIRIKYCSFTPLPLFKSRITKRNLKTIKHLFQVKNIKE